MVDAGVVDGGIVEAEKKAIQLTVDKQIAYLSYGLITLIQYRRAANLHYLVSLHIMLVSPLHKLFNVF